MHRPKSPGECDPCSKALFLGASPSGKVKAWRGFEVDVELQEDWLERLNRIPNVRIYGTCAGHPDNPHTPSPYVMFLWYTPSAHYDAGEAENKAYRKFITDRFGEFSKIEFVGDPDERYLAAKLSAKKPSVKMTQKEFEQWWLRVIQSIELMAP